ncbi:carboxypeptidase-like regulatory domain-containing protein [Spirosoma sp.]|uniref:carboxypeptidase-like regulatory domain-containing protein n=1 Tax=Spirosoma sp. TaxID=1899569 RepID=UPI003B3A50E7
MKTYTPIKALVVLLLVLMYVQGCRTTSDIQPTSTSSQQNRSARVSAPPVSQVIGPYTVTFTSISEDGLTWSYTIQRTGPAQGNGLSHWIINLGACVSYSNVISATIDGQPYTNLANSEGSGTNCNPTGQFLKFDDLPAVISDGALHTFTFTLDVAVDPATVATYVKAGNSCTAGTITGPGCYHICGNIVKEAFVTTITNSTTACISNPTAMTTGSSTSTSSSTMAGTDIVVTVSGPNGETTVTTDGDGNYCMTNLMPGNYTVSIPTVSPVGSETITVKPGQSQMFSLPPSTDIASFTVTTATTETINQPPVLIECAVPQGCSFSQGYWFAKPGLAWPGNVTVGGKSYSQAEGAAIWNTSNSGGIPASKKVFLQVAAIKLSGGSVLPTASVWADVATAEAWLNTLPKLTPTNLKTVGTNAAAVAAADRISAWIALNHCD